MAITFTADKLLPLRPGESEIIPVIAGVALVKGNIARIGTADGKAYLASAGTAGSAGARGIILKSAGIGQATDMLKRGPVGGFDLSGLTYDQLVYLDDGAGSAGTAAGAVSKTIGRTFGLTDVATRTKAIYFDFSWTS